jgi:hypothetical protein
MDKCDMGKEGILKTRIWREKEEDEEKLKPLKALCNASMQHCVSATELIHKMLNLNVTYPKLDNVFFLIN